MNSDTVRVNILWSELEPCRGEYDEAYLNWIESLRVLANQQGLKLLPVVRFVPCWVPGQINNRYVTTQEGYDLFGLAVVKVLSLLGSAADFVEICNEPNVVGGHSDNIPSYHYGMMAAHAVYCMYSCPAVAANKFPLVGALLCESDPAWNGGFVDGDWWTYLGNFLNVMISRFQAIFPFSTNPFDLIALSDMYRFSIHPYPKLGSRPGINSYALDPSCSVPPGQTYSDYVAKYGITAVPPAHPSNIGGDRSSSQAIATVSGYVNRILSNYQDKKLWITETGVSGWKIGRIDQGNFYAGVCELAKTAPGGRVEGVTFWPLTDSDWGQRDSQNPFYQMAPVNIGYGNHPAGDVITYRFGLAGL